MSEKTIVRLPGKFRFFTVKQDAARQAIEKLDEMTFFMSRVQKEELSFLAPEQGFEACRDLATGFHEESYAVLRIITEFGPTSRGLLARSATLLADSGMQVLGFSGAAGIYFAVPEDEADRAAAALESLSGPIPGTLI